MTCFKKLVIATCLLSVCLVQSGYTQLADVRIFAHNDYLHQKPFHESYQHRVDYIEADVFYKNGKMFVAHTAREIEEDRTLDELYLSPIEEQIKQNKGTVFADSSKSLTLMIDLKTEGSKTLKALVEELKQFPVLTGCKTLIIAVSGNVPSADEWRGYPEFIHFDGRPENTYTVEQLQRVVLISSSFRIYSSWNGRGEMSNEDRIKLTTVVDQVHALHKPIRFWAAPDFEVAWKLLVNLGVDVVNTDDVQGTALFLRQ